MAGIISDVSSDIQKLQKLKAEIESIKKSLTGIDVRVNLDIKENIEAQLKSLMGQYSALVQKMGEEEGKIMLSVKRINDATEKIIQSQNRLSSAAKEASSPSSQNVISNTTLETDGIKAQAKAYEELKIAIEEIDGVRSNNITRMLREQEAMRSYQKELKQLEKSPRTDESNRRFVELTENIERSKIAIAELRQAVRKDLKLEMAAPGSVNALAQSLSRMKDVWKDLSPEVLESTFGKELTASIQQADDKVKELTGTIGEHQRKVGQYENATKGLRAEQRGLIEEIATLTLRYRDMTDAEKKSSAGKELDQKITNLTNKAAQLKDAMADVNRAVNVRASDTSNFTSISEGINLIVSGFGAATGAAKLLGISEEDLLEVQTKLQAAYVASSAITKIQNSLQKESALMRGIEVLQTKAATAAINIKTASEGRGIIVTKAATLAQSALNAVAKANPYLLLASAIASVVGALWAFSRGQSELKKQSEEFNKSIADTASKPISKIEELSIKWNRLGDDLKAKEKFVRDYKKDFQELETAITGVSDAENLLNKGKKAFIESQIEKAKAVAYLATAQDKIKELIKAEEEYKSMPEKVSTFIQTSSFGGGYYTEVDNLKKSRKKEDIDKLREEIEGVYTNAAEAERKGAKILEDASISATEEYTEGSRAAIKKAIAEKNELLDKLVIGSDEYNKLNSEIEALQKKLSSSPSVNVLNAISSQEDKISQLRQKQAIERKRQEEDLEYQAAQARIDAMAEGSEKVQAQMRLDHEREIQEIQRQKQEYIRARIQEEKEIFDAQEELKAKEDKKYKKKTFDASTVTVDASIFEKITKATIERQGNDLAEYYKEVLAKYQDYTTKRLDAKKKFDADLKKLEESGGTEAQKAELEYQREETYKAIDSEFAMREDTFQSWADGIADMALEQLRNLLVNAEKELERMEFLNPNNPQLAVQRAKVASLEEAINKKETGTYPDKRSKKEWQDLYNTLSKVEREFDKIGKTVGGTAGEILSAAGGITTSTLQMIDGIVQVSDSSSWSMLATATAAEKAIKMVENASVILAIIGAALQIATKIASLFAGSSATEYYESLKEELGSINEIYGDIIEKSKEKIVFGGGFSSLESYKEANDLLERQIENYRKLAEAGGKAGGGISSHTYAYRANERLSGRKSAGKSGVEAGKGRFEDLSKALGKNITQVQDLYNLTGEELYLVQTQFPEAWSKIPEEITDSLQAIIDCREESEKLRDALNEAITGVSFDSFYNEFIDMLSDMDMSAEDMAENFGEYLRKSILAAMVAKNFQEDINELYDKWVAAGKEDSLGGMTITEDEARDIQDEYKKLVDAMVQARDNMSQAFGWDSSATSQDSSSRGFQTMSQDTAEELNGRFTALQVAGEEIENQSIITNDWLAKIHASISATYKVPDIAGEARNVAVNSVQPQFSVVFPTKQIESIAYDVSTLKGIVDEVRTLQANANMEREIMSETASTGFKKMVNGLSDVKKTMDNKL